MALAALVSQARGVPAHAAVLDQAQLLADRQVELEVFVEQAAAVPEQVPPALFQVHPRSTAHMVLLTLVEQAAGVPLHASVALLHTHPVWVEQVVRVVLSLHWTGVPRQLGPAEPVQAQAACAAQALEVVWEVHGSAVPEQVPGPAGQVQPGWATQVAEERLALQTLGVPVQVPAVGVLTRQPGTAEQLEVDSETHEA